VVDAAQQIDHIDRRLFGAGSARRAGFSFGINRYDVGRFYLGGALIGEFPILCCLPEPVLLPPIAAV